ncbi:MAG TPA: hypothetical protein VH252_09120 [Chthoniobacterales bacterium]|nr:hypothetical protein [Chthoniobacterales bacterium]
MKRSLIYSFTVLLAAGLIGACTNKNETSTTTMPEKSPAKTSTTKKSTTKKSSTDTTKKETTKKETTKKETTKKKAETSPSASPSATP